MIVNLDLGMLTNLHHYSEDPGITRFIPRPVRIPHPRPDGHAWLNGPLVWAIEESHAFLYLFPRDCPRIVTWATKQTRAEDRDMWLGDSERVAFVQADWVKRIRAATLYRYALPEGTFIALDDIGMAVSKVAVTPLDREKLDDLPKRLETGGVALKPVQRLAEMTHLFNTSLHVSAIRLRNAS